MLKIIVIHLCVRYSYIFTHFTHHPKMGFAVLAKIIAVFVNTKCNNVCCLLFCRGEAIIFNNAKLYVIHLFACLFRCLFTPLCICIP